MRSEDKQELSRKRLEERRFISPVVEATFIGHQAQGHEAPPYFSEDYFSYRQEAPPSNEVATLDIYPDTHHPRSYQPELSRPRVPTTVSVSISSRNRPITSRISEQSSIQSDSGSAWEDARLLQNEIRKRKREVLEAKRRCLVAESEIENGKIYIERLKASILEEENQKLLTELRRRDRETNYHTSRTYNHELEKLNGLLKKKDQELETLHKDICMLNTDKNTIRDKINSLYHEYQDYRNDKEDQLNQLHQEILDLKQKTILIHSIPEQRVDSSQDKDTQIDHLNTIILQKDTQITQLQRQQLDTQQQERHLETIIYQQAKDLENLLNEHTQLSKELQSCKTASTCYDIKTQSYQTVEPNSIAAQETHYEIPEEINHTSQIDQFFENLHKQTENQYLTYEETPEDLHGNVFKSEENESHFECFDKPVEDIQLRDSHFECIQKPIESPVVEHIALPPPPKASAFNLKTPAKPSGESFSQDMPVPSYHMPLRKTAVSSSCIASNFSKEEPDLYHASPAQDYILDPFPYQTSATSSSLNSLKNKEKYSEHTQQTETLNPFASGKNEESLDICLSNYWKSSKQTSSQCEEPSEMFSNRNYWEPQNQTSSQQEEPSEIISSNYWKPPNQTLRQQEESSEIFSSTNHWEPPKQASSQQGLAEVFESEEDQSSPFTENFWNPPKDSANSFFNNLDGERSSKEIESIFKKDRVWQDPFAFFKGMEETPLEEDAGYVNPLKSLFR